MSNSYGGNLSHPFDKILINTLSVNDFGVFTDSVTSEKVLLIKKGSMSIPWNASKTTFKKIEPKAANEKFVTFDLDPVEPAVATDYEYGVGLIKKVKKPGRGNSDFRPNEKFYGGVINRVSSTGGYIDDVHLENMEDDIIEQVTNDVGIHSASEGAYADAYRCYILRDTGNTDASGFTVTWADGSTYDFTTAASFSAGQLGIQFNADANVNTLLEAHRIATDTYMIISKTAGLNYNLTAGTDVTIDSRRIGFISKYDDILFEVRTNDLGTTYPASKIVIYDSASFAANAKFRITWTNASDDTTEYVDINSGTNVATVVAAIHAAITSDDIKAEAIGTTGIRLCGSEAYKNLVVTFNTGCASTISLTTVHNAGAYSSMSTDDVFRTFANKEHAGILLNAIYTDRPMEGYDYVKYIITYEDTNANMHGASQANTLKKGIEIYVRKNQVTTNYWDANNYMWDADSVGYSADTTLDGLFTAWQA